MKTYPLFRIIVALVFAVISAASTPAQPAAPNPTQYDPVTGLPIPQTPPWKAPDWKNPDKVLDKVEFNGWDVSVVADYLRKEFTNALDIVVPGTYQFTVNPPSGGGLPAIDPATGLPISPASKEISPGSYNVSLQLRNVTASEIFNAMNMEFEAEHTPVQWRLVMNGSRPTAVLHVVPEWISFKPTSPQLQHKVFFIGDLLGGKGIGEDEGQMRLIKEHIGEVLVDTGLGNDVKMQTYSAGKLLVITGTPDQIDLAEQTLRALKQGASFSKEEGHSITRPSKQPPVSQSGN